MHGSDDSIDRHLDAVAEHLGAVMWEYALRMVQSAELEAERRRPAPAAAGDPGDELERGVEAVVARLREEAIRMRDQLAELRLRSAARRTEAPSLPAVPAPPPAVPREPDRGPDPEPDREPEASGTRRRASLHDRPLVALFHGTDEAPTVADRRPEPEPPQTEPPRPEPPAADGEPARLIDFARTVEVMADRRRLADDQPPF